jgi:hypothetical protein
MVSAADESAVRGGDGTPATRNSSAADSGYTLFGGHGMTRLLDMP